MQAILIKDAQIVNEGKQFRGSVLIQNGQIAEIFLSTPPEELINNQRCKIIDGTGKYLIPGVIDDQVHFREPGLTHKAEIYTEAKAAVAGGITSYMEMPNSNPQTITQKLLNDKFNLAAKKSLANFSFYIGATNDNIDELLKTNPEKVCGIKIFMGSSTGNMLVDNIKSLENIFSQSKMLIATHCEDENTVQKNIIKYKKQFGENIPINYHPKIRSEEACYKSSSLAVKLAKKYNSRLHLLHISTAKELDLLDNSIASNKKRITAEACIHHLWFDENDYDKFGTRIKWNPAIKTKKDKKSLLDGVLNNKIDVIATDHAPHLLSEKQNTYFIAPSGGPLVQHSLVAMLELYHQKKIPLVTIIEKMCHSPANIFNIKKRGFIRKNYWADLVLVDLSDEWKVESSNILYKCKWSPFENQIFKSKITHTFVNGNLVYQNGKFNENIKGKSIEFNY